MGLSLTLSVFALESDRQQKITLSGDGCISKLNLGQTECPKGMLIRQGSLKIESDYGLITHEGKLIATVKMTGSPVTMEQQMDDGSRMVIRANQIDFDYQSEIAFLKGDVRIENNIGVSTGEAMEFNLKTQEVKAVGENNQQFRLEIDPNND
ncbi:hypothetical protein GCM10011365_09510 [Marinicella pacifica]|uniref:Organic solvent tolerance-like N-terminal domain-containing protein n=2 Tax=Marinicella pacifica TaxID=1171543 RepID=A0A917CKG9_9GAMM|nr:hypothetical protein GCM10011365_09510 [Marinicella pacifica]